MESNVGAIPADAQAAGWGFNLLIPPVAPGFCGAGLPYLHDLQLSRCGPPPIREDGVALPDVFDPQWVETIEQVINALVTTPMMAGWMGDQELKWGATADETGVNDRPGLLQVCLGLDPAYRAYHSAWEFVLARHGGELSHVAEAWGVTLSGRGAVRQMTRDETMFHGPAYQQDLEAFTAEFAERYFSAVRDATRLVNASRLLFSPTLLASTPEPVAAAARRHCDVAVVTQSDLPASAGPELLVHYNWSDAPIFPDTSIGESELEAMIREGRRHLVGAISRPNIVGYAWTPFRRGDLALDLPTAVGLLDDNGRENVVFSLPLSSINSAAGGIRAQALAPAASP
ncbi:MAG: hypothetical protein SynsKO_18590 [Synoicihabitans sp.]